MRSELKVSWIVPAFDSLDRIDDCLRALRKATPSEIEAEWIVVENGPGRPIPHVKDVQYVKLERPNRGAARNAGAKVASGEFLIFVDVNVALEPGWLLRVLEVAEISWVDVVQSQIEVSDARQTPSLKSYWRYRNRLNAEGISLATRNQPYPFLDTAALLVRRQTFLESGGFDESLSRCEDTDFSIRFFLSGFGIASTAKAIARKRVDRGFFGEIFKKPWEQGKAQAQLEKKWPEILKKGLHRSVQDPDPRPPLAGLIRNVVLVASLIRARSFEKMVSRCVGQPPLNNQMVRPVKVFCEKDSWSTQNQTRIYWLDRQVVLVDLENFRRLVLDGQEATSFIVLLKCEGDLLRAAQCISEEFETDRTEVALDLRQFLDELTSAGFLQKSDRPL